MPERIEPCLALLAAKPPVGERWAFEVKWDGYRLAIHIGPGRKIRIITRGGFDWTARFPSIAAAARKLPVDTRGPYPSSQVRPLTYFCRFRRTSWPRSEVRHYYRRTESRHNRTLAVWPKADLETAAAG